MATREAPPAPPIDADFYGYLGELTDEESRIRLAVRRFMDEHVAPSVNAHWEAAEFPHHLVPRFAELELLDEGGIIGSTVAKGLISMELARVDPGWASFFGVHAGLAMPALVMYGSDEQKREWLPRLARWDAIAGFGLTEPDVGSGAAGGFTTVCRREGDEWVLNGQKKWIGNATFGDLVVVLARDLDGAGVRAFLVRTTMPGYGVEKIGGKISQRTVQSGLITLTDLRLPESDRLPGVNTFAEVGRLLRGGRAGVAWQAVGCASGAYEHALAYAQQRRQFGRPIGGFQMIQAKLVTMLGNLTAMLGMALRVSRMQGAGVARDEHTALAKQFCAARCRETVALAREIQGGNGVALEFGAARLFADAEAIYSYEGTNEMTTLIVGRAITGHSAFV
jgi:glutaryl-CoA dehydrogenase